MGVHVAKRFLKGAMKRRRGDAALDQGTQADPGGVGRGRLLQKRFRQHLEPCPIFARQERGKKLARIVPRRRRLAEQDAGVP